MQAHLLLRDPMVVVLPDDHPALARPAGAPGSASIDLHQLAGESWVTILAGHAARAQFDRITQDAGFTPNIRFLTESYDVAQAFVGTGIGVARVSRLALRQAPHTTYRELRAPAPYRQLYAIAPANSTATPLVSQFLTLLLDVAADISTSWPPAEPAAMPSASD